MKLGIPLFAPAFALLGACHFHLNREYRRIGEVEARAEVGGARRLVVRNTIGEITLRTDAEAAVSAKAIVFYKDDGVARTAGPDDLRIAVEGDAVIVENAHGSGRDKDDWKMDLTISAPPGLDLELSLGVGDCVVSGAFGQVKTKVGVGDLNLSLETVRGGKSETGVGDVDVAVSAEGPSEEFACETGVGDLTIAVPASFGGEVAFDTGVGSIDVRNAGEVSVRQHVTSAKASGRVGEGGPRLTGKSGVGSISFARR